MKPAGSARRRRAGTAPSGSTGLDEPAGARAVARLDAMVERRRAGEPIQYVVGSWGFRRLDLMVDERVLIPRPETELVVEVALDLLAAMPRPVTVVDLGTGSGAIALALADETPLTGVTIWATDISEDALDVARANIAGLGRPGTKVRLAQGSWFEALPPELKGGVDLLVSNPPYVATEADAPVVGPGLGAARRPVRRAGRPRRRPRAGRGAAAWLRPGGAVLLEIGADQGEPAAALAVAAGFGAVDGPTRPRRPRPGSVDGSPLAKLDDRLVFG